MNVQGQKLFWKHFYRMLNYYTVLKKNINIIDYEEMIKKNKVKEEKDISL